MLPSVLRLLWWNPQCCECSFCPRLHFSLTAVFSTRLAILFFVFVGVFVLLPPPFLPDPPRCRRLTKVYNPRPPFFLAACRRPGRQAERGCDVSPSPPLSRSPLVRRLPVGLLLATGHWGGSPRDFTPSRGLKFHRLMRISSRDHSFTPRF